MAYEPLHHKYRPQTFAYLVGQSAIAATLSNAIEQERIVPAYLFTGPRGTGKTSSARILAKSLNCIAGDRPTPTPCGKCETCRSIIQGSALDVIEIDAASNTGVDNIREIIERAQFAPVQCRYKVYVIDECLTGDSLIATRTGLIRIDDPKIQNQEVLSYNEEQDIWEYKKVSRWLNQGKKETLTITTGNAVIRCTGNHLIRTDQGWIKAQQISTGMKILSPVNAGVDNLSKSTEPMAEYGDLSEVISLATTSLAKKATMRLPLSSKQQPVVPSVSAVVGKSLTSQNFYNEKAEGLKVFNPTGKDIPTKKAMVCGISEPNNSWTMPYLWNQIPSDSSMALSWATVASTTPTPTVAFPDCDGLTVTSKQNGWNIKPNVYRHCLLSYDLSITKAREKHPFVVKPNVTQDSFRSLKPLNRKATKNWSQGTGSHKSPPKVWLGGTWTMVPSHLMPPGHPLSSFIQKDFPGKKTNSLSNGSQNWGIPLAVNPTLGTLPEKPITTQKWGHRRLDDGCQICVNIQSPQWHTSFERVESITSGIIENVYDIEVEDNHNFVANGLLVHNCHMLSTAAFNALLKTLEEPPERVVFVLATTDPQRVLPTIISRCQRFDYRRIALDGMVSHLRYIANQEQIHIDDAALTLVAQISNGGLRDAESLLDQLSLLPDLITPEKVWDLVGAVPEQDLLTLLTAIASNDAEILMTTCRQIMNRGREPLVVLQNLAAFYLNLLIARTAPHRADLVAVTKETWQQLCELAPQWDTKIILFGQQKLKESEVQLRHTTQPRLWLEVSLLGLLPDACGTATPAAALTPTPIVQNPAKSSLPTAAPAIPINPIQTVEIQSPPKPSSESLGSGDHHPPVHATPIASPEPIPTNSAPEPTPPPITENQEEIWTKVLAAMLPFVQSLVQINCSLDKLEGNTAWLSYREKSPVSLIQSKLSEVEKAFQLVCGRPIRIQLNASHLPIADPTSATQAPVVHSRPPVIPPQAPVERAPSHATSTAVAPRPESPSPKQAVNPEKLVTATSVVKPAPRLESPSHQPQDSSDVLNPSQTRKAIEQFAKNFAGEVIVAEESPIEESESIPTPQASIPAPVESPPPQKVRSLQNRPAIAVDNEEDLPF